MKKKRVREFEEIDRLRDQYKVRAGKVFPKYFVGMPCRNCLLGSLEDSQKKEEGMLYVLKCSGCKNVYKQVESVGGVYVQPVVGVEEALKLLVGKEEPLKQREEKRENKKSRYCFFVDGATVGQNGKLGSVSEVGIGIYSPSGVAISKKVLGISNNEAEFIALIEAMYYCLENGYDDVAFYMDSQIVHSRVSQKRALVDSKNPKFESRNRMNAFHRMVQHLETSLNCSFHWIPREENEEADRLSKKATKQGLSKERLYRLSE